MEYKTLISAQALHDQISACIIIDCRFSLADRNQGLNLYRTGHLPGAYYADLETDLSSPILKTTGRHPLPDFDHFAKKLGEWSIDNHTQVVAYDDLNGSFAARFWWLMRALGHQNVAVLDGGIQAWQSLQFSLDQRVPAKPDNPINYKGKINASKWWDTTELIGRLKSNDCVLIDARAHERFSGKEEPIDPVAGHIPSALNLPITQNFDDTGCFLSAEKINKQYQDLIGDIPPNQVVHSCGSGVFACLGILAMEHAGLKGSKLYPGSWSEWIREPARGVETY